MEWQDTGLVLAVRRHGEADVVLEVITPAHGRHCGYVKGGAGRRKRGELQPGNLLKVTWRSRIEENLGRFTTELMHSPLGIILEQPKRLAAMSAMCSMLSSALAEREAHLSLYEGFKGFIAVLENEEVDLTVVASSLVRMEAAVLQEMGFGLDLSECVSTGALDNLIYVSPKSGRAVSADAGAPYKTRMLPLPAFLLDNSADTTLADCHAGMELTGFFLARHVWQVAGKEMPQARSRFMKFLI